MFRTVISHGSVAGLIVGIPLFTLAVVMNGHPPLKYGVVLGHLTMLITLSAVFLAVKRHRDEDLGGVIRFWPALGLGLGISLVAGVFYMLAWEAALAVTGMDDAGDYAKALIIEQQAKGASAEALAKFTTEMEQFKQRYANPLFRLPMTLAEIFPIGVLVSLSNPVWTRRVTTSPRVRASATRSL